MNNDQGLDKSSNSKNVTESSHGKAGSSSVVKASQGNLASTSISSTSDSMDLQNTPSSTPRKEQHTPPLESPAESPRTPSKNEVSGRPTREVLIDSPRRAQYPFGVPRMLYNIFLNTLNYFNVLII